MNRPIDPGLLLASGGSWDLERKGTAMKTVLSGGMAKTNVDAVVASRGREAVVSLAARGFMWTWLSCAGASILYGEITDAGRIALAWVNGQDSASVSH